MKDDDAIAHHLRRGGRGRSRWRRGARVAHTEVKSTSPAKGATASTSIRAVTVTFTQAIQSGTLRVTGPGGSTVSNGSGGRDPRKVSRLRVGPEGLAEGRPLQGALDDQGRRRPHADRLVPLQAPLAMRAPPHHRARRARGRRRGCAAPAAAHVQVTPTAAAPGDPVKFELLSRARREAHTTEVALQMPKGVLPFSFEDQPGWKRTIEPRGRRQRRRRSAGAGGWRPTGSSQFSFLAATPEQEGELVVEGGPELRRRRGGRLDRAARLREPRRR